MSPEPFFDDDDLPDFLKEILKNLANFMNPQDLNNMTEMMKKFNEVDPEELEEMLRKMFGEDYQDKIESLSAHLFKNMGENFDPNIFSNFKQFTFDMNSMKFTSSDSKPKEEVRIDEEAYAEIIEKSDTELELIVDLPGITDQRQINWEIVDGVFILSANATDVHYQSTIDLPDNVTIDKHLSKLNNSVYILPMRKK
ncbi:MAG: hypothetical protein INQ03_06665 [Candidatus Heimdallarchaeota archaeon]|nr:hypothetical protein [Candidatus Heimdallarchaeota archaeon]